MISFVRRGGMFTYVNNNKVGKMNKYKLQLALVKYIFNLL